MSESARTVPGNSHAPCRLVKNFLSLLPLERQWLATQIAGKRFKRGLVALAKNTEPLYNQRKSVSGSGRCPPVLRPHRSLREYRSDLHHVPPRGLRYRYLL